jgi:hypothetical protein
MQLFDSPANGTAALAAFVANCFTEALPPVDFLAVCFVLAIMKKGTVVLTMWACAKMM